MTSRQTHEMEERMKNTLMAVAFSAISALFGFNEVYAGPGEEFVRSTKSVTDLVKEGYEIKGTLQNYIILQKGQAMALCEMVSGVDVLITLGAGSIRGSQGCQVRNKNF